MRTGGTPILGNLHLMFEIDFRADHLSDDEVINISHGMGLRSKSRYDVELENHPRILCPVVLVGGLERFLFFLILEKIIPIDKYFSEG